MGNISKNKREDLIDKIDKIKNFLSDNEQNETTNLLIKYLYELENEINSKKYGLLFEEHEENVDIIMKENCPIVKEDKQYTLRNGDNWNFLIEGDNLAALNILKKTHKGAIDVIYIDPPYNTGNKDFIYDDAFVDKTDTFKHSKWISFLDKRLKIAQKLLSPEGVIFISIDDNEQAVLKLLCDSIFGEENFLTMFIRKTKSMTGDDGNGLNIQHEYLLAYARDKTKSIFVGEPKTFDNYSNPDNDPNGIWTSADPSAKSGGKTTSFPIENPITGQVDYPPKGRYWAFSQTTMQEYIQSGRIKFKDKIRKNQRGFIFKRYAQNMKVTTHPVGTLTFADNAFMNSVATTETNQLIGAGKFSYPKPVDFIKKLIKYTSKKDSIILDFFAGSGTTGHAVMELNKEDAGSRKYIICTNNENNICKDVTHPRIKKSIEENDFKENLKYFTIDFVEKKNKLYYEYADSLLLHVTELVELENAIDFESNKEVKIILKEEQLRDIYKIDIKNLNTIYLGHDILLSGEQINYFVENNVTVNVIPEHYYKEIEVL